METRKNNRGWKRRKGRSVSGKGLQQRCFPWLSRVDNVESKLAGEAQAIRITTGNGFGEMGRVSLTVIGHYPCDTGLHGAAQLWINGGGPSNLKSCQPQTTHAPSTHEKHVTFLLRPLLAMECTATYWSEICHQTYLQRVMICGNI